MYDIIMWIHSCKLLLMIFEDKIEDDEANSKSHSKCREYCAEDEQSQRDIPFHLICRYTT